VVIRPDQRTNKQRNSSNPQPNRVSRHRDIQRFESITNFHYDRVCSHRREHSTDSLSESLHCARVLSQPPNDAPERFTDTLPKILNSTRDLLHPVIEPLKEVPEIRVHFRNEFFTQLADSSPRQRHGTSHSLSSTLRRPAILLFHDTPERRSVHLTVRHHLAHLFTSDTELFSKSGENVNAVLSELLDGVTHETPITFDLIHDLAHGSEVNTGLCCGVSG